MSFFIWDILRLSIWPCIGFLELFLMGCSREPPRQAKGVPEPLNQAIRGAGPGPRQAITIMCTATQLFGNYGDELQVAWRLHILTEEARFKPSPADRPFIRMLLTNGNASPYSRMCAAYFLADSDMNARSLLTNYAASANQRHRFNAARTIQWFASHTDGEACSWASLELIKLIENRSLELPYGTYQPTPGYATEDGDFRDDDLTPLGNVVFTLGYVREKRAIPALKILVERQPRGSYGAVRALGQIGDASVGPFLLSRFTCEQACDYGASVAMLKYRPAIPHLVNCLGGETNDYITTEMLRDLVEIGDSSVLPSMEQFVSLLPERARKTGARFLVQMRERDPCAVLLAMLEGEKDEHGQIEIIRDLSRYHDHRAIDKLFAVAVSSEHTLLRGNAIGALRRMDDKRALLALIMLMKTNAPPPIDFDKMAILAGRPPDYSKRESAKALREATRQDFGDDAVAWSRWVMENR